MFGLARRNNGNLQPWNDVFDFGSGLERIFDEMRRDSDNLMPKVSVTESPDSYKVSAEFPGVSREDIKVEHADGVLRISAERKRSELKENEKVCRDEVSYGFYERRIMMPDIVDSGKVDAQFKDGILTVTLPKVEPKKPTEIKVK